MNSSGGFGASVPLDLPFARGGLPVPVQITYGERGIGAAGLGWDVPLSYIRRDMTVARRRPVAAGGAAPQGREQVSMVLDGRHMDLVRTATAWVARGDAPDIEVREQSNGWVAYDGQGRTYVFAAVSSALAGTGVWLLQDITGPGGSKVHLDYAITTPTVSGTPALTIDLTGVSYNPHPTTANCYKSSVVLSYDNPASAPLSLSVLGTTIVARLHKLTTVDVTSRESCGSAPVRLRRYQLSYDPDPDTRKPRLKEVKVSGREGKPEASTPITIAGYSYGTATSAGQLTYAPQSGAVGTLSRALRDPPPSTGFPPIFLTETLLDVTGDGRPDKLSFTAGQMRFARNTSSVGMVSFADSVPLSDNNMSDRALEASESTNTSPAVQTVWRQMIDVNGDGRVDMIDARQTSGKWTIYLSKRAAACTTRPVIVFIDNKGRRVTKTIIKASRYITVTNDFDLLVEKLK